jgi:hypothetical protein
MELIIINKLNLIGGPAMLINITEPSRAEPSLACLCPFGWLQIALLTTAFHCFLILFIHCF